MKSKKKSLYKIALLLVAIGSMAFLYRYGYHKVFDYKNIHQNTDGLVIVDVKTIRNYYFFSCLKNPSVWQWKATNTEFRTLFDLSNYGIKTEDYQAFFHISSQPIKQWHTVFKIDDKTAFEKATVEAHFHKANLQNGMISYYSSANSLLIIKHSNRILVSNISERQKQIAIQIAEDLFLKNLSLDVKRIEEKIDPRSAITFWIKKNSFLEEDGMLKLKLEDKEIIVDGQLKLNYKKETKFSPNPNALLSFGFDFEMIRSQNILKKHSTQINKMIGFDLDSILSYNPTKTELFLNEIVEKKDSAISYDYDDDFNPIKKVVVHTNREPSFYFSMQTTNSKKAYNFLKAQNVIDNHQVFVNFPLARTKTSILNNALTLEANPLKNKKVQVSTLKIGYLQVHLNKLQPTDWSFIIAKNKNFSFLKHFETFEIDLSKENNTCHFQANLKTRDEKNLFSIMK